MERKVVIRICAALLLCFLSSLYFFPSTVSQRNAGISNPTQYNDSPEKPDLGGTGAVEEQETTLDGVYRYTRRSRSSQPKVLLLVLTKDADSWGHNLDQPTRQFNDFIDLLKSTNLELSELSLGLLTSDKDQYHLFKAATPSLGLGGTTIFLHPGYLEDEGSRDDRHDDSSQMQRRAQIAKLRNYLMLRSLRDESHIVWIDSDIYELHSPQIISRMLSHAHQPDVGMITARCEIGPVADYDANAWAGSRQRQALAHAVEPVCTDGDLGKETQGVAALIEGTSDDDLVQLDSVGATLLYMRASLVHRGLTFPDTPAIGATWERTGWDGIESEGLCYRAKGLGGGKCWTLGGKWYTRHTDR